MGTSWTSREKPQRALESQGIFIFLRKQIQRCFSAIAVFPVQAIFEKNVFPANPDVTRKKVFCNSNIFVVGPNSRICVSVFFQSQICFKRVRESTTLKLFCALEGHLINIARQVTRFQSQCRVGLGVNEPRGSSNLLKTSRTTIEPIKAICLVLSAPDQ